MITEFKPHPALSTACLAMRAQNGVFRAYIYERDDGYSVNIVVKGRHKTQNLFKTIEKAKTWARAQIMKCVNGV